jgi:prepilin-type N-terminal cleavage/methylation domain-containing protein
MRMMAIHRKSHAQGFSYVEVLVAITLIAIALAPAMDALQTGIMSANVHQTLTVEHYLRLKKMEELQAEPFSKLLDAAEDALNNTTPTGYSDAAGATNRRLIYIALYDADADPFTITDSNKDGDNDLYTGNTSNLLWVKVVTEGSAQGLETLISR